MIRSAFKPAPHTCCAHATHLRPRSFARSWQWICNFGGMALPIKHCPFCGVELPKRAAPGVRLVKRGEG